MLVKRKFSLQRFQLALMIVFVATVNITAEDYFHLDYVGYEQGLESASIEGIIQDSEGYMWFGTTDGLFKYDGRQAKKYSDDGKEGSLLSDDIYQIIETKNKKIWVATSSGGVAVYNRASDNFKIISIKSTPALKHYKAQSIIEYGEAVFVLGGYGIEEINQVNFFVESIPVLNEGNTVEDNYTARSLVIFDEKLLTLINTQVYVYDENLKYFKPFSFSNYRNYAYQKLSEHYSLFTTSGNSVYLYTNDGLFHVDSKYKEIRKEPILLRNNKENRLLIRDIYLDSYGTTWIITQGHGVFYKLHEQSKYLSFPFGVGKNQLNSDQVFSIYEDRTNNIWLGTDSFYVAKFRTPQTLFPFYSNFYKLNRSDYTNTIWSFEEFNGHTYLATDNGIFQLTKPDNEIKPVISTEKYRHTYDLLTTDGEMYIGGLNGLSSLHSNGVTQNYNHLIVRAAKNNITSDNTVSQLAQSDSHLFVGTFNGLVAIDKVSNETTYYNHANADYEIHNGVIMALAYDSVENLLWVGSETGIEVISTTFDKRAKIVSEILKPINGYVNDIHIDKHGNVWIAVDETLYRFTTERALLEYRHFPENEIRSIETVDNTIWMTTPSGMIKASLDNLEEFTYFIQEDGLYNTENTTMASIYLESSDELLFGGDKGFIKFNSKINIPVREAIAPKMNIVRLMNADGQPDILDRLISNASLKYFENSLRFEFAHLDFKAPLKTKFHYQLVGIDTSWSKLSNENYASYTNLKSGDYIFRVKVYDANNVLSDNELSIHFTIETAWWKSDFAYFMYFALFLFSILFIMRWYKAEQIRNKNLQIQKNKEEFISGYNRYALSLTELQSHQTLVRKFLDQIKLITGAEFIQYKQFLMEALLDISIGKQSSDYFHTAELELTTKNAVAQLYFKSSDLDSLGTVSADIQILFQQMIILQSALIDKQKYNWNDYFSSVTGLHNIKTFKNILSDEIERAEINDFALVFFEWRIEKSQFKENELLKRIQLLSYGDKLKEVFGIHLIATFSENFDSLAKFVIFMADENTEIIQQYESKFEKMINELLVTNNNEQAKQNNLKLVRLEREFSSYVESL